MLMTTQEVDNILLSNPGENGVIDITEWVSENEQETKTFIVQINGKFFQGTVVRTVIDSFINDFEGVSYSDAVDFEYSHERGKGLTLVEVEKHCTKDSRGNRYITYRNK